MKSAIGRFAVRHATSILFLVVAICVGGAYCAVHMPSSVFPQANFPRVVIMVDDGSTDSSREILSTYAGDISLIELDANRGANAVRIQVADSEEQARAMEEHYLDSIPPEAGLIELSSMYGLE